MLRGYFGIRHLDTLSAHPLFGVGHKRRPWSSIGPEHGPDLAQRAFRRRGGILKCKSNKGVEACFAISEKPRPLHSVVGYEDMTIGHLEVYSRRTGGIVVSYYKTRKVVSLDYLK